MESGACRQLSRGRAEVYAPPYRDRRRLPEAVTRRAEVHAHRVLFKTAKFLPRTTSPMAANDFNSRLLWCIGLQGPMAPKDIFT
jgi:hypothetical protein